MNKNEFIKSLLAGIFFLSGVVLIILFIFTIGKDKGLAESKFEVTVLFRNVGGLNEGAPVRLSGVTVGSVGSIDFMDQAVEGRHVKVVLNVFEKYKRQVRKSTTFAIRTEGILGEKLIESYVDEEKESLDIDQPIIGLDPVDVQDLAVVFASAAESF
ncbi:MAG: MCE family protein, partial [Candidatus Omnitrophica bacterium]|nr:MCE family protein [Candidatus Omnitrophota bacterium]